MAVPPALRALLQVDEYLSLSRPPIGSARSLTLQLTQPGNVDALGVLGKRRERKRDTMTADRPWFETVALDAEQGRKVAALQGAVADLLAVRPRRRRRRLQQSPFPMPCGCLPRASQLLVYSWRGVRAASRCRPPAGCCRTRRHTAPSAPAAPTSAT